MKIGSIILLFILFTLLFLGCSREIDLVKKIYIYGYNFTNYTSQGFLFTPEPYMGEYESIAILEIEIYPEIEMRKERGSQYGASNYDEPNWTFKPIQTKEVLDSLFYIARRMGADAIVRLSIHDVSQERQGFPLRLIPGKKAYGFAIKRNQ